MTVTFQHRNRAFILATTVASAMVLAGCSGDDPSPTATPSATATATAQETESTSSGTGTRLDRDALAVDVDLVAACIADVSDTSSASIATFNDLLAAADGVAVEGASSELALGSDAIAEAESLFEELQDAVTRSGITNARATSLREDICSQTSAAQEHFDEAVAILTPAG